MKLKLAVLKEKNNQWELIAIKDGTEKDIEVYEEGWFDVTTYYIIPFWPWEDETTGFVWDKFDNTGQYVGRIENGRFVRWLDPYESEDVFESLWGNIF